MVASHLKLLNVAAKLFVEKGYHKTSTREISLAAGINSSAISYYFGDKAGLYLAILELIFARVPEQQFDWELIAKMPRKEKLMQLYHWMPLPALDDELQINAYKLMILERFQPSGIIDETVIDGIHPRFGVVTRIVNLELGISEADYDAKILAISIMGLRVFFNQSVDLVTSLLPSLLDDKAHADYLIQRLADFADHMIEGELKRRQAL